MEWNGPLDVNTTCNAPFISPKIYMKKIILPFALLSALSFAQIAAAQSNVTVYGSIDLGVGRNIGDDHYSMMQGAASRLGFKGQEDLGGGLKASFHLQHRYQADTGAPTNATKFWHADSWVGLEGSYGQVRLGRMFTPSYQYVMLPADVFEHSRVSSNITTQTGGKSGASTSPYRFDNGINYNIQRGGFRLGVTFAPNEDVPGAKNAYSAAASYASGKFYVAAGTESQSKEHTSWNTVTAHWGDQSLKVRGFYGAGKNIDNQSIRSYSVGASGKVGIGTLKASYARMDNRDLNTKVQDKFALGYYYALSKRTTVYTDIAHDRAFTSNRNGFDVGMMHWF